MGHRMIFRVFTMLALVVGVVLYVDERVIVDRETRHELHRLATDTGMKFEPPLYPAKLGAKTAAKKARAAFHISARLAHVEYHLLTHTHEPNAKPIPVYIVSYRDRPVTMPFGGPAGSPHKQVVNTELNVLVNAETGSVLNAFSYR